MTARELPPGERPPSALMRQAAAIVEALGDPAYSTAPTQGERDPALVSALRVAAGALEAEAERLARFGDGCTVCVARELLLRRIGEVRI